MKRLACLIMVVALVLSFASCAKEEKKPEGTTATETQENPFKEHFTITYLIDYNYQYKGERWDELELEEKFNIDLVVPTVEWNQQGLTEHLFAMLASGDVPDMAWYPPVDRYWAYEEGLHRSVNMDMVKEYMPSYYELLEQYPGAFTVNLIEGTENEYVGLSMVTGLAEWCYFNYGLRLDWLEKLGYEINDLVEWVPQSAYDGKGDFAGRMYFSNRRFTYDEFLHMNRAFTEDDPDGDGQDNTYFAIDLGFHMHSWLTLGTFGMAGNNPTYLYKDKLTGDIVPYYAFEGYRDFLQWRKEALEKGYIRKLPGQEAWLSEKKMINNMGVHGFYEFDKQNIFSADVEVSLTINPPGPLLLKDSEAKILFFPGFEGPMGIGGNSRYRMHPVTGASWTFGAGVSDEKLIRILQFMEYTHFDSRETYLRYQYGIEGIHWKWEGEPYKSSIFRFGDDQIPEEYRTPAVMFRFNSNKFLMDMELFTSGTYFNNFYQRFKEANNWDQYLIWPDKIIDRMWMTDETWEVYDKLNQEYSSSIDAVRNDFYNRVDKGQVADINAEWQAYIEALYSAGLGEIIEKVFNNDEGFVIFQHG
jgi:hypothetical protein